VLTRALDDPEPPVREHAAWALRRFDGERDMPLRPLASGGGSERRDDVSDARR
jgi:hypothetical protein